MNPGDKGPSTNWHIGRLNDKNQHPVADSEVSAIPHSTRTHDFEWDEKEEPSQFLSDRAKCGGHKISCRTFSTSDVAVFLSRRLRCSSLPCLLTCHNHFFRRSSRGYFGLHRLDEISIQNPSINPCQKNPIVGQECVSSKRERIHGKPETLL